MNDKQLTPEDTQDGSKLTPEILNLDAYLNLIGADRSHANAMTIWKTFQAHGYLVLRGGQQTAALQSALKGMQSDKLHMIDQIAELTDTNSALQLRVKELEQQAKIHKDFSNLSLEEFKQLYTFPQLLKQAQSRIAELEREVAYLRGLERLGDKALEKYQKLAEKLMRLLEKQVKRGYFTEVDKELIWQSYCKEHGLKQPD